MIHVSIQNDQQTEEFLHAAGPMEFGRMSATGPVRRCVIEDRYVSKDHLRIEELPDGRVRIENLSRTNPVHLPDSTWIATASSRELDLPLQIFVGQTRIELRREVDVEPGVLGSIARPVRIDELATTQDETVVLMRDGLTPEQLVRWFETVIGVQRAAVGSTEFFGATARALVDLVGLDRGMVLLRKGESWEVAACHGVGTTPAKGFSRRFVQMVMDECRTYFRSIDLDSANRSLEGVEAIVGSPIFDAQNQVIGILYGSRFRGRADESAIPQIGTLEAQVVQLLAAVVGTGIARQGHEAQASRARIQFEQFFSPELAAELERDPKLLEGQEREVTVLFVDIRDFSRRAERLPPRDVYRLASDVLERITHRIREQQGVVVDYVGDGVMAMWNAPTDQPDHALRACRAALAILEDLPEIERQWNDLGGPISVGIGLNTGPALVGNAGTRYRMKYGPRGHTVNLASRVEGATKHFGVPILMTGATFAQVREHVATRRIFTVRLVGIEEAVELYELARPACSDPSLRQTYEAALDRYEHGDWAQAYQILQSLAARPDHDVPTLHLLSQVVDCLRSPPESFDPVLVLRRK